MGDLHRSSPPFLFDWRRCRQRAVNAKEKLIAYGNSAWRQNSPEPGVYALPQLTMRAKQSERSKAAAVKIELGRGRRDIDDAVSYALTHRTRVEIRAILNDGKRSRDELARMTDHSVAQVGWHLKELLADGTIYFVDAERVGSAVKYYYSAAEVPSYSEEEFAAMPAEARKRLVGVALQTSLSEALAAFWAGRMIPDRHIVLAWRWFNVDRQGREAMVDEQTRSWIRMQEIGEQATGRVAESGDACSAIFVSSLRYVRARLSSTPPLTVLDAEKEAREVALRLGRGGRSVEKAVSYAISDKLRIEILIFLNESERTRYELADLMGETPNKIKHHLRELMAEGSIERAYSMPVGNVMQHYYRAVEMPSYGVEEYAALPPESRQAIVGVALQTLVAEALAALRVGTMINDPRLGVAWRKFHVDAQGREELSEEQQGSWARVQEIESEVFNRVAKSGEPTESINVSLLGFVRSRRASFGGAASDTGPVMGGIDLGSQALSASRDEASGS